MVKRAIPWVRQRNTKSKCFLHEHKEWARNTERSSKVHKQLNMRWRDLLSGLQMCNSKCSQVQLKYHVSWRHTCACNFREFCSMYSWQAMHSMYSWQTMRRAGELLHQRETRVSPVGENCKKMKRKLTENLIICPENKSLIRPHSTYYLWVLRWLLVVSSDKTELLWLVWRSDEWWKI